MFGITFGELHSFNDWGLILTDMEIEPAKPKTTYVEIPGGDGSLDFTESLGEVRYSDREITFKFVMNTKNKVSEEKFEKKKTQIANLINGAKCKVTLDSDENYYFLGRCTIDEHLSNGKLKQIVVKARVHPYKFKQNPTVVEQELSSAVQTVTLLNGRRSVVPRITCTADNTKVMYKNITQVFSAGTYEILDFQLKQGENLFTVSGSGTITFEYQEADL